MKNLPDNRNLHKQRGYEGVKRPRQDLKSYLAYTLLVFDPRCPGLL